MQWLQSLISGETWKAPGPVIDSDTNYFDVELSVAACYALLQPVLRMARVQQHNPGVCVFFFTF